MTVCLIAVQAESEGHRNSASHRVKSDAMPPPKADSTSVVTADDEISHLNIGIVVMLACGFLPFLIWLVFNTWYPDLLSIDITPNANR